MPKQNTSPTDYPQAVLQQIEQLAQNIVIARRRRGETQAQWAKKLGVSQPTMARIERGDPSVAMASYVMCLWLVNPAVGLADLIAPANDHAALEREVSKVRQTRKTQSTARSVNLQKILDKTTKLLELGLSASNQMAELRKSQNGESAKVHPTAEGLAALLHKTP